MRVWPSMPKDLSAAVALSESPCRSDPVLLPLTNTRLLHQRKGDGKWTANSFRFWRSRSSWRHQAAPSRLRRSHRLRLSRLRLSRRRGLPTSLRLRGATHVFHLGRAVTQVAARRDLLGKGRSRTAAVEPGESVTGQGANNPLVLLRFRAVAGERRSALSSFSRAGAFARRLVTTTRCRLYPRLLHADASTSKS
jgi:hypothetical protein